MSLVDLVTEKLSGVTFGPIECTDKDPPFVGVCIDGAPVIALYPKRIHRITELCRDEKTGVSSVQLDLEAPSHIRVADDGSYYTGQVSQDALDELDEICALRKMQQHCDAAMAYSDINVPSVALSWYRPCLDTTLDGQVIIRVHIHMEVHQGMLVLPASTRGVIPSWTRQLIGADTLVSPHICMRRAALCGIEGANAHHLVVLMTACKLCFTKDGHSYTCWRKQKETACIE